MAGPPRYTAFLDACVLYPAPIRDLLLTLHKVHFFAVKWTARVEEEWVSNLLKNRPDLGPARIRGTCEKMRSAAPDWEVSDYESIIEGLALPDQEDRHVLAASIRGHADCIVTANTKHFPKDHVGLYDIEVFHPDDFLMLQLELDSLKALKAIKALRLRLRNPPMEPAAYVANLADVGLSRTAAFLTEAIELL
jgi:hypothetical protein